MPYIGLSAQPQRRNPLVRLPLPPYSRKEKRMRRLLFATYLSLGLAGLVSGQTAMNTPIPHGTYPIPQADTVVQVSNYAPVTAAAPVTVQAPAAMPIPAATVVPAPVAAPAGDCAGCSTCQAGCACNQPTKKMCVREAEKV